MPNHPARKLFVNLPVSDLQKSIAFFDGLGFTFNPQFTDETTTCMLVGEDAYFMLLANDRFGGFTQKPIANAAQSTEAIFAFSVGSRQEVDALVDKALATGGKASNEPQDHGFMYGRSFQDLDDHLWEVFWMDPAAVQE